MVSITRRSFVQGLAAGGLLAGLNSVGWTGAAAAQNPSASQLSGNHFDLTIDRLAVNITGRHATAVAVNGVVPGPILRWREGEAVTLAVTNRLKERTSIHWHGVRVPAEMDGVPGVSFPGISPGATFTYRFPVLQNGTYWYHSHSAFQEQLGLHGALIIDPNEPDEIVSDRDYVVMLTDWTDGDPETIYTNLKQQSDYYNYGQRTAGTLIRDIDKDGFGLTLRERNAWDRMNMSPTDISDVSGAVYTYLINGWPAAANWTALFSPGERIRLRFINAASMTFFDVRIPGLPMTVVHADGNNVEPVTVDEFRMGNAETYDVIVTPTASNAYTIWVQSEDRSGYARATLAPRPGMSAAIPPMDPRPIRSMVDMGMGGMAMQRHDEAHSEMAGMSEMAHGSHMREPPMERAASAVTMDMSNPLGIKPYPQPGPHVAPQAGASSNSIVTVRKPAPIHLRRGPQVDNVAAMPVERLNDPGDGLRDNGRRVLTYADLRARYRGADPRPPSREIELHLTGNMERYIWGFDGEKFSSSEPLRLKLGERVRFILINDTMMEHPIHLHGLWSELENGEGEYRPYKHTIVVKPGERLSYLVSADTPGRWAYHCHLAFHMEAGMFREVIVS